MNSLMSTYAPLPVTFERGEGAYLYDTEGKKYLDAVSGIAVTSLGHAHEAVADALCQQAHTLIHTSNLYQIENQKKLAEKLCQLSGMSKVFFSNSGAEANEAAIKLARLYGKSRGVDTPNIIVTEGSFHGRTMATLSATGSRKVQAGFSPLLSGFVRVPYNDVTAIERTAQYNADVVAILVEPVQGEGGVVVPDAEYLSNLRDICDKNNWLLMLDEIQTGMCRTGEWFGFQHTDIKPDVMTLAKALGNGVPIGACLAADTVSDVLTPGSHGSTFGGNPLSTRAGLAVVEVMESENIKQRASEMGRYLHTQLAEALSGLSLVKDIRSKGLMLGIALSCDCGSLVAKALEQGLLINVTAGNVVRLLPPLTLTKEQARQITTTLTALITELAQN
ncbi:MAG: aspartate aminotransferase family protein [Proteobacteria bacterium]|nr:MAG: aspartate aminotransferase family protein [Pseudomonadota bacterium]